jgi:uracil permease
MIKDVDLNENKNLFVVSAILIAGIGGLAIQIPYAFGIEGGATVVNAFVQVTPVATALILGIITNAVLSKLDKKAE